MLDDSVIFLINKLVPKIGYSLINILPIYLGWFLLGIRITILNFMNYDIGKTDVKSLLITEIRNGYALVYKDHTSCGDTKKVELGWIVFLMIKQIYNMMEYSNS